MAFIERTYDLDRYAGVTGDALPLRFFFPSVLDEATGGSAGWVVEVALRSVVAGRDDSQLLAWYKKFNLCIISLFGILWGFGAAVFCCFFAMQGRRA